MAITQEIDLNLIPSSAPVIVHLNQYDEGKGRIIAHLYNGSNPYVPGVNATVKVQGTKPDKHAFQYWCDIDGATVTVDVNVQMTAVAGLVPTQLIVNETSGITGSFAFQLDVQASTLPSNIDVSETDLPILTEEAQEAARRAVQAAASAEESAEEAAAWSANPPYIGENLHWYVYDTETEQFVDSGVIAEGQDGDPGNKWYKGTAISGESSTPTVFPSSGIALAYHNDFYLNSTEGSIYHCETPGDASTATWVYDFKLTGGGSGGVTNYNDLTNKPKIGGVELTGNKTIADLGGAQSFNGRSGSILPVAGDYKSNQIILSSIMHIGGGTQDDVQEALEALDSKDAGGSTITVTTAEVTLRGKNVTLSDGVNTWTKQFDNAGKAIFTSIMSTGALSVTASDGTETASGTINAPYFGNYTKAIAFWQATIAVTTTTTQFNGLTVSAKKNGVVMGSGTFDTDYGKNFLKNTATTQTINGVTFTVNADKSVTVNGTAISDIIETIGIFNYVPENLALTGCPSNGAWNTYRLDIRNENNIQYGNYLDTGNGVTFTPGENYTYVCLRIGNGTTVSNLVFKPMIRRASDPDDTYVPYHDPITSASITVPEAGTYNLDVTLDWKTYTSSSFSVTEETTYNETINGFIAPISLTTPTSEFYGQSIAVTRNGVAVPVSLAFSNSGTASFTALDEGTYLFTLTYGGEPYTASVVVSAETTYSAVIKMWTATINITTASSQLQSQDIDVYKGSAKVATIAFNASGQASYLAHESGTYHFVCTVDGYPFTSADVAVSDETVYSTSITYFGATLNISTSSSDLYSQTITIKKGSTTVGTTAFSAQGSATYTVHETGTYTAECEGHSDSVTVSAETTYNVTINAGLDLQSWLTEGGVSGTYADFAALEADEAAVRQLMLVHDAVDYLATASAGDSLMQSVINSDVCAKWINLSDYALDTLSANSDIADEMDTADKYGYGEWGIIDSTTTPPTWGALGNVPIMTGDSAPYGNAIGTVPTGNYARWKAFDGDDTTVGSDWQATPASGVHLGYDFVNPICPKMVKIGVRKGHLEYVKQTTWDVKGSNDGGATWVLIQSVTTDANTDADKYAKLTCTDYYKRVAVFPQSANYDTVALVQTLQFYGRELPVKQASAPTDGREYVHIGSDYYTEDWGEKEFATGSTRKTIYDHGVELVTLSPISDLSSLKPNCISVKTGSSSSGSQYGGVYTQNKIDMSNYTMMGVHIGKNMYRNGAYTVFQLQIMTANTSYDSGRIGYEACAMGDARLPDNVQYVFGTAIQQEAYANICTGSTDTYVDITEWWLE